MFKFFKGLLDGLSGKTARRQAAMAEAALAEQRQQVADEKLRLDAVQEGQRRVGGIGGRRGLLAFIEDQLKTTLGGA